MCLQVHISMAGNKTVNLRALQLLSLLLLMTLSTVAAGKKNAPTAIIGPGRIIGTTTVLPSSTATVNKFLSIPYAVTPPKRFQLPERLTRYDAPVNATQLPHLCIQQNYG